MATLIHTLSRILGKRPSPPAAQVGPVTAALRAMRTEPTPAEIRASRARTDRSLGFLAAGRPALALRCAAILAKPSDPFETDTDLRAVRETVEGYVAACRTARARSLRVERRAEAALRRTAAV